MRAVKELFPDSKTILGVSNVSFGLPGAGREVLNSVFLYHCTKAGLDAAIVNTEKLARYADIPAEERELAEALIFLPLGDVEAGNQAVEAFTAHFRGRSSRRRPAPRRAAARGAARPRRRRGEQDRPRGRPRRRPSPIPAGRRRSTSSTAR